MTKALAPHYFSIFEQTFGTHERSDSAALLVGFSTGIRAMQEEVYTLERIVKELQRLIDRMENHHALTYQPGRFSEGISNE